MSTYHHTDELGQAVTGTRKAVLGALEQLTDLATLLEQEREMHRAEVTRLVQRAEDAEVRATMLVGQLNTALASEGDARTRAVELEAKLATAEDRAAGWNGAAAQAQERVAELEGFLATARATITTQAEDYRQARERITELEDQAPHPGLGTHY